MKKIFTILILSVLVLNITACKNNNITNQNGNDTGIIENNDNRQKLELEDYRNNPVNINFEEDELLQVKNISLTHTIINERLEGPYNNEEELDVLVNYIKDTLNIEINSNWSVFIHYSSADKDYGMVEFTYNIGEIKTNRSIMFNINKDKYDMVYYKCLTENIDEDSLIDRVNKFKNKYVQGERNLKEDETFFDKHIDYTYYINADKLVYSYSYFFKYNNGIINNDYGTIRLIDTSGSAIQMR